MSRRSWKAMLLMEGLTEGNKTVVWFCLLFALYSLILLFCVFYLNAARAEYGDVVINNFSDKAGIRPPIFPHWFHRIRFRCKVCHGDLGFELKAGGNKINMLKIINGEFCGACHNGRVAWSVENCELCHSGTPGTPTQMHKSTLQTIMTKPRLPEKS